MGFKIKEFGKFTSVIPCEMMKGHTSPNFVVLYLKAPNVIVQSLQLFLEKEKK